MILPVALVAQLAGACAPVVAPGTLAALAATESGFDPLAIYDNTARAAWRPRSKPEAVALARRLIGAGHTVDLGLMQVDLSNLARLHLAVSEAFDPCVSLSAGARVLADAYRPAAAHGSGQGPAREPAPDAIRGQAPAGGGTTHSAQQAALRVAFSRYNTGSPRAGFLNGYVARVLAAAKRVVPEIDIQAAAPEQPKPAAGPPITSWEVFGGPKNSGQPSSPSSWNVFPQSVGPDRLANPPPAAAAGTPSLPATVSVGGAHD